MATTNKINLKVGQLLTIFGVSKPETTGFAVNICPNLTDIALHVNPRFSAQKDQNVVVLNSYENGKWDTEIRRDNPFTRGQQFTISIEIQSDGFEVKLPNDNIQFRKRMQTNNNPFFSFSGNIVIQSITTQS